MKKLIVGGLAALAIGVGTAPIAQADQSWTMPNLVGKDLQGAQDAIQSLTHDAVWLSTSTDLTGKGRAQIVDRNWIVCTSTPTPGTTFTAIENTSRSPINGTFDNLTDGGTITIGNNTFQANYEGGDGNDLTLTVLP